MMEKICGLEKENIDLKGIKHSVEPSSSQLYSTNVPLVIMSEDRKFFGHTKYDQLLIVLQNIPFDHLNVLRGFYGVYVVTPQKSHCPTPEILMTLQGIEQSFLDDIHL